MINRRGIWIMDLLYCRILDTLHIFCFGVGFINRIASHRTHTHIVATFARLLIHSYAVVLGECAIHWWACVLSCVDWLRRSIDSVWCWIMICYMKFLIISFIFIAVAVLSFGRSFPLSFLSHLCTFSRRSQKLWFSVLWYDKGIKWYCLSTNRVIRTVSVHCVFSPPSAIISSSHCNHSLHSLKLKNKKTFLFRIFNSSLNTMRKAFHKYAQI